MLVTNSSAQELTNVIPKNQKPILKTFPPSAAEQAKGGTGKFVIFSREPAGKDWDFIAEAWECIPSHPEIPVTKRVEFCHSSWNAGALLDILTCDNSSGMYPQFVKLQVDSGDSDYAVNLYNINYQTWGVDCIWQGSRLSAFGVMGESIFCNDKNNWFLINTDTGELNKNPPFIPIGTDGAFWLVRKAGETEGCWSYDTTSKQYVAHFGAVDEPTIGYSQSKLSADGRSRAWVIVSMPADANWRKGVVAGKLILQQDGRKDISVPVEMCAFAGDGVPMHLFDIQLLFSPNGKFQFCALKADKAAAREDQVWEVDMETGKANLTVKPHSESSNIPPSVLDGVPVPDYLRPDVKGLEYFGRGALAPAFLLHLGLIKEKPVDSDCTVGVSRDGRHVLFRAKKGPLAGAFIYGDLVTKQVIRWKLPKGFDSADSEEFVWVETPKLASSRSSLPLVPALTK
jgi:hypothetical protein